MALLSEEMDSDLLRLWGLVAELSEQLNANRVMTAALQSQAAQAKVRLLLGPVRRS
jgi:outer membrane murein-binding lipoprotein Lpp